MACAPTSPSPGASTPNRSSAAAPPISSPAWARTRSPTARSSPWATRTAHAARADAVPHPGPLPELLLPFLPGPRDDWFTETGLRTLTTGRFRVSPASNRIGLRTEGPPLERARSGELPSEGMPLGALQVPPNGLPVLFLHDHPTTGGYPVIGVVPERCLAPAAQAVPGTPIRFVRMR